VMALQGVPEKRWPQTEEPPRWTLDLSHADCVPSYGGPNSFSAPHEISFATEETLGMAFPEDPRPMPDGHWKSQSCVISIDVKTGELVTHRELQTRQPTIVGMPSGNFAIDTQTDWLILSPKLGDIPNGQDSARQAEAKVAAQVSLPGKSDRLRIQPGGMSGVKLWFDADIPHRLLATYDCGEVHTYQLREDRILVIACTRFSVFNGKGILLASEDFVRPKVNFAAISRDHGRFALAVYVWGFGDPSYLEEETIVVYDVETLRPVIAVKSQPLPKLQSWAALSPSGFQLAVGAEKSLRLYTLPH
jgi:hypothetical protein